MEEDDISTFAKRLKEKFPEYADIDDVELVERTVRKHPVYAKQVKLPSDFSLLHTTTGYKNLDALYENAGREYNVDPNLLLEQGRQETINFNPDVIYGRLNSPKGAQGAGQFMPGTAPMYGVTDRTDPVQSINGQAQYMRKLLDQFDGDEDLALAGYNAGEHRKSLANGQVPKIKETQDYVRIIGGGVSKARAKGLTLANYYRPSAPSAAVPPIINQPNVAPVSDTPQNNVVPESSQTIEAQARAASDPAVKGRAAVLTTSQDQNAIFGNLSGFQAVPLNDGKTLWVNVAKAKKLKLRTPQDIDTFFRTNKDAVAKYTGTAVNVGDNTATGATVLTTLPNGVEASAKIVPDAQSALQQTALDKESFPNGTSQIVDAEDVVDRRAAELVPGIEELGAIGEAAKNGERYVPDMPQTETPLAARPRRRGQRESASGGSVSVSLDPADFKIGDERIVDLPREGILAQPRELGRPNDNLNTVAGEYTPIDPKDDWDAARQSLTSIGSRYGITPQQVDTYLNERRGSFDSPLNSAYVKGQPVQISFDTLAALKGKDEIQTDIRMEQSQSRPGLVTPKDLHVGADFVKQDADWLNENAGSALKAINPLFEFLPDKTKNDIGASLVGGAIGSGGRIANTIAGLARGIDYLNPTRGESMMPVGMKREDIGTSIFDAMRNVSDTGEMFERQTGTGGYASQIAKIAGGTPGDMSKLILLSALPGGTITGMSLDHALTASGQGKNRDEILKQAGKGAVLGAIFRAAPTLGRFGNAVAGGPVAKGIARETLTSAVILGGTYQTEKLFGTPDDEAARSAIVNTLFHLMNKGVELVGKAIRVRNKNGESVDVTVDPEGQVKLLKGQAKEPEMEMYVDAEKGADGIYRAKGDTSPMRTPEAVGYRELPPARERGNPIQNPEPSGNNPPLPTSSLEAQRIESIDQKAVERASTDKRTRKIADVLRDKDFTTVDEISQMTRIARPNVEDAVMTLYGAGRVELMPGNKVRLIQDANTTKANDLFEKAKNYGQTLPQPPAQVEPSAMVQPEQAAAPKEIDAAYAGKTFTNPVSKEPLTLTGERNANGNLIAKNNFGRERSVAQRDADNWLAANETPVGETQIERPVVGETQQTAVVEPIAPTKPRTLRPTKTKHLSLSQFVRANGGIMSSKYDRGEVRRISNKETGSSGLINSKSGMPAERMAELAWEAGYLRDIWPTSQDRNGDEFMGYVEDDLTSPRYAMDAYEDFDRDLEKEEQVYYEKKGQSEESGQPPAPVLRGSPQPIDAPMTARVLYAKERGMTTSDIAQRYNLTPEQVEAAGALPRVGEFGKMSNRLIQASVPAKQATTTEIAEKTAFVNDLAAELDLPVRLNRDSLPDDHKNASDTIRKAIANEMGKERGSHLTQDDWFKWLDTHGGRLNLETVETVLDAMGFQTEHTEKVNALLSDKGFGDIVDKIDETVGLENLRSFNDIPNRDTRNAILSLAKQYGILTGALKTHFNNAISRFIEERNDKGRSSQRSVTGAATSAPNPAQKGTTERRGSTEELTDDDIPFARTDVLFTEIPDSKDFGTQLAERRMKRDAWKAKRMFAKAEKLSPMQAAALSKFSVDDNGMLRAKNVEAWKNISYLVNSFSPAGMNFAGFYMRPAQADMLRQAFNDLRTKAANIGNKAAISALDKQIAMVNIAMENSDLTFSIDIPELPHMSKHSAQEELGHRFNERSGLRIDFNEGTETLQKGELSPGYANASVQMRVDERFAKSLRDDAEAELGIGKKDTRANRLALYNLIADDPSVDTMAAVKVLAGISRKGVALERYATRKYQSERDSGTVDSQNTESYGDSLGSRSDLRESRFRDRRGSAGGDPDRFARLRQADLYGRDREADAESQALSLRKADTPATKEQMAALRREVPNLGILFSLTDPFTKTEATFLSDWIKNNRETPIKEIVVNFRRAGLLTGFRTHLRNMLSNAAFQASEEATLIPAVMADLAASAVTGKRTVTGPSPMAIAKGFRSLVFADETMRELNEESGIARAWNILKNGSVEELRKNQVEEMKSGLPLLDKFINGTFRLLGAEDALFKTYAMRRHLEMQAKTIAVSEANDAKVSRFVSPLDRVKSVRDRRNELLKNPTKAMLLEAMLYADFSTFTNDNPISDWVQGVKNLSESGKAAIEVVMPYDRTPTNIVLRTLEYTPLGFGWAGKHLYDLNRGKSYTFDNLRKRYEGDYERLDANRQTARMKVNEKFRDALDKIEGEIKRATTDADKEFWKGEYRKVKSAFIKIRGKRKLKDAFRDADRAELEANFEKVFPRVQQEMFARSFGRAGLGSAALMLGVYLAARGLLSGVWDPGEYDEDDTFYERQRKGILNGSLVIGNRRYQINDTPMGKVMVLGASIYERSQLSLTEKDQEKDQTRTQKDIEGAVDVSANLLMEQPMLNSLDEYFGSNKPLEKRLGGLLGSFVPTIVSDIADVSDDSQRSKQKIYEPAASRIPGLRQELPTGKYPREPYMQKRYNRIVNKFDPTNSRPVER